MRTTGVWKPEIVIPGTQVFFFLNTLSLFHIGNNTSLRLVGLLLNLPYRRLTHAFIKPQWVILTRVSQIQLAINMLYALHCRINQLAGVDNEHSSIHPLAILTLERNKSNIAHKDDALRQCLSTHSLLIEWDDLYVETLKLRIVDRLLQNTFMLHSKYLSKTAISAWPWLVLKPEVDKTLITFLKDWHPICS